MSIMNVQSGQVDTEADNPRVPYIEPPGVVYREYILLGPADCVNVVGWGEEPPEPERLTCCPCCGQWFNVKPDGWPEVIQ